MSPVRTDDDVSDGSSANESAESCKQTPMKTQVRRDGRQKRVTELIFCPLVSASPHRMLNLKGKPPVDCGYSGDVRAPELMKLMKQIFELYASNGFRLQICQTFSDHEGLSQQSFVIQTPKYHKQYLLPDRQFPEAAKAKTESFSLRRERNKRDLKEFGSDLVDFTFAKAASNKGSEKRSRSVHQVGSESSDRDLLLTHLSAQSLGLGMLDRLLIDHSVQIHS
ncbi:putative ABI family protein [Helianthus annuus]|uniref:ABI family protein n=1 Tax=Helianthus annuus TaxID=4232 RepID=A0A9K3NIR7_HELAN|nr:putative ABI family protein [Helianthus annuus]KAJ0915123.1 putative ABI family protein [Helianthus annuus]